MNKRLTPPEWANYDPNMLVNVSDMQYYFENFTDVVDVRSTKNELAVGTLDGRVTALEQSTPVGPGGKGAYLNLGGTPERYPTAEEMAAGDTPEPTSFLVVARTDGIYFYNPKSKLLIPPKKGGGTIAIHAQFPQIFETNHAHRHEGRTGMSGIFTAKTGEVGLDGLFLAYNTCTLLVVANQTGEEYQTAFSPDGTASRIFRAGDNTSVWTLHSGGGGGGGSVDPAVIQEINRRLGDLESKPEPVGEFSKLSDVVIDTVSDVNGFLYLGEDGKVRGGSTNPMLGMGYVHVHNNSLGASTVTATGNIQPIVIASSPFIVMTAEANRTATLPNIVPFDTYKPSTTQIREGRVTYFINTADTQKTLRVTSGQQFYKNGSMDTANVVVPGKTTYVYNAAIIDNGSGAMLECFVYMGQIQHQDADMSSILDGFTNLSNMHDAQQVEIDFIRSEQEKGKLTVEGLQSAHTDTVSRLVDVETLSADLSVEVNSFSGRIKDLEDEPNPSFFDLTDTPSAGDPGKLVGYNLAGNALTSYDRVVSITNLSDVPNSMTGHATKVMTVKVDESGFEFTDFPRVDISPLEDRVTDAEGEIASAKTRLGVVENNAKNPAAKNDFHKVSLESTNNFQASMSAEADVIVHNLGVNSNPRVWLPEVVATGSAPTASQVLVGRKMIIVNTGAQATKVGGAMMHFSDTISTSSYELPVGHSMEMYAHFYSSTFGWRVVRSGPILPATGGGSGGSSTFVGLTDTPATLTAKKIITVNAAGNALEMSQASTDDLAGALTLAAGVVSGNSLLSGNCLGAEVVQDGRDVIPSSLLVNGPVLLASVWKDVNTLNLPNIAKFDTQPLTSGCVREGRITSIYNCTGNSKSIVIQVDPAVSGVKFQNTTGTVISNFTLVAGKGIRLMPVFDHLAAAANQRFWMILEVFNRLG